MWPASASSNLILSEACQPLPLGSARGSQLCIVAFSVVSGGLALSHRSSHTSRSDGAARGGLATQVAIR